jgi:hypothetical protein
MSNANTANARGCPTWLDIFRARVRADSSIKTVLPLMSRTRMAEELQAMDGRLGSENAHQYS